MIRALRPTDLGSYLGFRARTPANDAILGPTARPKPLTIRGFIGRSLALNPGHEAWVQIEHGQIYGLSAARARFGTDVWDIDHLMIGPSAYDARICVGLLDHLSEAAVEEGVQKVFLRLTEESPWAQSARQAGFVEYATEHIYILPELNPVHRPIVEGLRHRRPSDHQPLFQFYSTVVPAHVRQIEALTLQEWRWTDTWGLSTIPPFRPGMSGRRRDFVVQTGPEIDAWLQVHQRSRVLQVTADPRGEDVDIRVLLDRGLAELGPGGPVVYAIRDYQSEMIGPLEERGFRPLETHALLAHILTLRVPERRLMPARVV